MKIVARHSPDMTETDISGCFDIVIGDNDKITSLRISVRDGWVEIRVDGRLDVQPNASNSIRIKPEYGLA